MTQTSISVVAVFATAVLLRADDPPAITAPPGYKVIYHDAGNGMKMPVLVKQEGDPLAHANLGDDPLDHQKVYSETNPMANKTYSGADSAAWNKAPGDSSNHADMADKVYDTTKSSSIYDVSNKSTFNIPTYDGVKAAPGYDTAYAAKTANLNNDQGNSEFAAIGSSDQNQTAPIAEKAFPISETPIAEKKFMGPEEDARHRRLQMNGKGQLMIDNLPERPLTIDEVKNLINHGFKPDLGQPPAPASKPLNDPNYQPEPLRIEPPSLENLPLASSTNAKAEDDDKDDPVPSPGTMAAPPEPLPSK